MEALRTGVTTLSIFLLIGGCLLLLVPGTGVRKAYQFLLSLMTVLLILSCFSVDIDFDLASFKGDASIPQNTADSVRKSYISAAEQATAQLIQETLQEAGITPQEIFVQADISDDNSISIEYIEVILNRRDADQIDDMYQLLKREIGGQISVKAAEAQNDDS